MSIELNEGQKQQIEGFLPDYSAMYTEERKAYLEKHLPDGISPEQVDVLKANGDKDEWHWHLKPELIKDEDEREKYKSERKLWPRN